MQKNVHSFDKIITRNNSHKITGKRSKTLQFPYPDLNNNKHQRVKVLEQSDEQYATPSGSFQPNNVKSFWRFN